MVKYSRRAVEFSGLRDIVVRRVPIVTLDSGKRGPTVCITGCIHGNEPGGIAIVHELVKSVRKLGMDQGKVIGVAQSNSVGVEHGSR